MNKNEAAFLIAEIRNFNRYQEMIDQKRIEIKNIEEKINDMAHPRSANNSVTIKPMTFNPDGTIKSMGEEMMVRGTPTNQDSILIELITDKDETEKAFKEIKYRYNKTKQYINEIKNKTEQDEFMADFIQGKSYTELSEKYGYTNPYKHAISLLTKIDIKLF